MIKLVLVDDQQLVREGLSALLSLHGDLAIVGEAANGQEACGVVDETKPDVVLMDLSMPVCDGVTATQRIHAKHPLTKIIVLTTFDDDSNINKALTVGASGYLLKNIPSRQLADAIRMVMQGHLLLGPTIAPKVVSHLPQPPSNENPQTDFDSLLTGREMDIFRLLGSGKTNQQIAEQLCLSEGTVKNYTVVGEGAGGPVRGKNITLDSVEVEGKRVEDVRGVVLEGSNLSLLGQAYLSRMGEVEMSGDYMVLK